MAVRVIRPVARSRAARRRNGAAARERAGDVAVSGSCSRRAVHVVEAHVADGEAQLVQRPEHRRERLRVDLPFTTSCPVWLFPSKPQCFTVKSRRSDSGTGQPGFQRPCAINDFSSDSGQRSHGRVVRLKRDDRERQGEETQHGGPSVTARLTARQAARFAEDAEMDGTRPRAVILVEGISDQCALEALAVRRGRDLDAESISIVPDRRRAVDREIPRSVRAAGTRRHAGGSL